MATNNFIPTVWSENLYRELTKKYIAVANSNREYEGEIKQKGDTVKICGVGNISVYDYVKNSDLYTPDEISKQTCDLVIDQAKYFNFQIDDIDRAQADPRLMGLAMKNAADAIANDADKFIYGLYSEAGKSLTAEVSVDTIFDKLIEARTLLAKSNVTDPSDIVFEVSPDIAALILKAKVNLATENTDALENGCIGSIAGCKIFVSNNIYRIQSDLGAIEHKCLARTKRAIAYAEQISEIIAYRPELRFADAVKGLHLYGAKTVYPSEMVLMNFSIAEQA
ncbi:MAG: hypothetical protein E7666_06905 [Ruminococcaceae bacterium]|nr:hypothetical protein [Oscillospiraceae bacterium]